MGNTTYRRAKFIARLHLVPSAAGLHLCARLAPDARADLDAVLRRARRAGVAVNTLADFSDDVPAQAGLAIGFGSIPLERIEPGLRHLAAAFGPVADLRS